MKKILPLFFALFLSYVVLAQNSPIEQRLTKIADISQIYRLENTTSGASNFVFKVKQPIDHSDKSKGFFFQKVYLTHKGFEQPTVMVTEGYNAARLRTSELTALLQANQIQVEHRFFGASVPKSPNYDYLNLKQATADLHHIKELFGAIYSKKWISTGISKGGATTIFYRYFYPKDVDVSIPYVAPINKSLEEQRIYTFLDTIGTDECRAKIKAFQTRVLQNRTEILKLLKFYSKGAGAKYALLSPGKAFEFAVMEYPFSFWQWGSKCEEIPDEKASIEEITEYLIDVSSPTFFSDGSIEHYNSHYYQSATEMGYYGYETSEFKDLLKDLPTDKNPQATFFTFDMNKKFDGTLLNDLNAWLEKKGNKFIYIYGANDTWTASAVRPNEKVKSEWFILKGKHHGNARIKSMTDAEYTRFTSTLEKWLKIEISSSR